MPKKRLVLFDLDGTLVDSEDFVVWSFVKAGELVGISIDPEKIREMIGYSLEDVLRNMLSMFLDERKLRELINVRRELIKKYWATYVRLFPDVVPALTYLKGNGFLLGVASSSTVDRVILFLQHLGVLGYFDVISGTEPGVSGKPEPDVILRALGKLGISPDDTVYVGDRLVDCIASLRAGVDFILIARGVGREDVMSRCKVSQRISSLIELGHILVSR